MEVNEISMNRIIDGLNKKKNISGMVLENLEAWGLTEVEKNFIRTYKPEKSLVVYGTLAPNQSNHWVVEHIKGKWKKAIVRGSLEKKGWGANLGYYGFRHTSIKEQTEIDAFVLVSDELVAHWQRIDDFEGDENKRLLARYELDSGEIGVGYIYAINE